MLNNDVFNFDWIKRIMNIGPDSADATEQQAPESDDISGSEFTEESEDSPE